MARGQVLLANEKDASIGVGKGAQSFTDEPCDISRGQSGGRLAALVEARFPLESLTFHPDQPGLLDAHETFLLREWRLNQREIAFQATIVLRG
jgi:hypothetical protein